MKHPSAHVPDNRIPQLMQPCFTCCNAFFKSNIHKLYTPSIKKLVFVSEYSGWGRMSASDHAILDLGEDELQFTKTDYKAQVRWLQLRHINTACSRALELPWRSSLPWCLQTRQPRAGTLPGWWRRRAGRPPPPTSGHSTSISSSLTLTRWMWGIGKLHVFPSKGSPVFIILLLTGWCTVCCQCLGNHFYSITSDPG